jgi:hypothetical protein
MQNVNYFNDLVEKSIAAILSAIEIYNKPDFKYRNEIFCILVVNAWELLAKAKILKDNNNQIKSIYVYDNRGNVKTNRNGIPLTIEIIGALKHLAIEEIVLKNITAIIELRDVSMHFYNKTPLDYSMYTLGTACLKNYQKLIATWFKRDLLEYNFYILPIGFSNNFQSFSLIDLNKEPEIIQQLLRKITEEQKVESKNGFFFTCEIQINLISAKKVTDFTDITAAVDPNSANVIKIIKHSNIIERYPLTYKDLYNELREKIPDIKQKDFNDFIRDKEIKKNPDYSHFNFRNKAQLTKYQNTGEVANGTPSLYNNECLNLMMTELKKIVAQRKKREKEEQEEMEALWRERGFE